MKQITQAVLMFMLALTLAARAQTPPSAPQPTNTAQYTVNLNFLGTTPYGQSQALDAAGTLQFTTNNQLRSDYISIPGNGYTGALFGDQYGLCAIKPLENTLATTSFSCGKFSPYAGAEAGVGHLNGETALAYRFTAGANYQPTNSLAFNVIEAGFCNFGVAVPGQSHEGLCYQSGLSFLFGTNSAAAQAKQARIAHANAKKLAKINAAIKKAMQQ